jgi:hypothetical protein
MNPLPNDDVINNLNFLCKTYDAVTRTIASTKNRLAHLNPDENSKKNNIVVELESTKGKIKRQIGRELEFWPVWTEWMKNVPGIGEFIAGNLILLYYYRFVPVCTDCGTSVEKKEVEGKNTLYCPSCDKSIKGDGVLKHKIDKSKDFPNVSKWWAYMGEHVIEGKKPKMKKGVVSDWSTKGRQISYQVGESFNKMNEGHPYKKHLLEVKEKLEMVYPDKTKGHRHNMARMRMCKLFLSHFWHVARELEGKSTRGVYADVILEHTGIIPPYYWEPIE